MNKTELPTIGWSKFALERHTKKIAATQFPWPSELLLKLVRKHWNKRIPGQGRTDLNKVVIVPIQENEIDLDVLFTTSWVHIKNLKPENYIKGKLVSRQAGEDPYIEISAWSGGPWNTSLSEKVKYAKVVLYSADTLLENSGTRSTSCDWEVVAILGGPWSNEPMTPLTMARNYLQKDGGTFSPYTAEQFAESIYFWKDYIKADDEYQPYR